MLEGRCCRGSRRCRKRADERRSARSYVTGPSAPEALAVSPSPDRSRIMRWNSSQKETTVTVPAPIITSVLAPIVVHTPRPRVPLAMASPTSSSNNSPSASASASPPHDCLTRSPGMADATWEWVQIRVPALRWGCKMAVV
ncbi:hypothetical protein ABZP36_035065 [Zizania latifolia]